MPAYALIGGQWGDEGKGKVVDFLSEKAHIVARFNGGNNAGHTVMTSDGEFKFHLIPVGILRPQVTCIIGNGVVVDPDAFLEEISSLQARSVDLSRLFVSDRTHVVMPYHIRLDQLEEDVRAQGGGAIGTTGRGIGPVYMDKAARTGIRMIDFLDEKALLSRLSFVLEQKNALITKLYGAEPLSLDEIYEKCRGWGRDLKAFIRPVELMIQEALAVGQRVILEGAQGTMLDLDHGTYPYVTSSNTVAAQAATGSGAGVGAIDYVLGIAKASTTRVGAGPFPTELNDDVGRGLGERGREFGTVTGRERRCGWFDAVMVRQAAKISGLNGVALTKLDVLDGLGELKVCTAYRLGGETLSHLPSSAAKQAAVEPVYESMEGWSESTQGARSWVDLPTTAIKYIRRIEELISVPVALLSTSPERDDTILVRDPFGGQAVSAVRE